MSNERLTKDAIVCVHCHQTMVAVVAGKSHVAERAENRTVKVWRANVVECPTCGWRLAIVRYDETDGRQQVISPVGLAVDLTERGELVLTYVCEQPVENYNLSPGKLRSIRSGNQPALLDREQFRSGQNDDE